MRLKVMDSLDAAALQGHIELATLTCPCRSQQSFQTGLERSLDREPLFAIDTAIGLKLQLIS